MTDLHYNQQQQAADRLMMLQKIELVDKVQALKKQVEELKDDLKHCADTQVITGKLRRQLIKDGLADETPLEKQVEELKRNNVKAVNLLNKAYNHFNKPDEEWHEGMSEIVEAKDLLND